jgi:hypothetical protein
LVSALVDENRFVVAHVLLSTGIGEGLEFDAGHWNGLKVTLNADNSATYPEGHKEDLRRRWVEE